MCIRDRVNGGTVPVDRHRAAVDQLLQVAARELGHQHRQRTVEALPVLRLVDEEAPGLAGLGRFGALFVLDGVRKLAQRGGRYN